MGRPWEAGKAVGASSPPHMGAVWVGWGPQEGVQHSEVCVQGLLALGWQTERASQGCVLRWWLLPKQLSSLAWVDSSGVAGSPCLSCICPCDHMSDNFFYFEILHTYARTHRILHLRQPPLCPPPYYATGSLATEAGHAPLSCPFPHQAVPAARYWLSLHHRGPVLRSITKCVARVLQQRNIRTVTQPPQEIKPLL